MIITTEYLDIKDISVDSGLWYSKHSVNSGNNLNWSITADAFNNKNTRQRRFEDMITISRNSVASYFDYDGILKFAPANVPRMEYNPTTKQKLGLKVEGSSTNLLPYSEDFTSSLWGKGRISIESNQIQSPTGDITADKLVVNSELGSHSMERYSPGMLTVGQTYTISAFVKAAELYIFRFWWGGTGAGAKFNLASGKILSGANATIAHVGNGWYRCTDTYVVQNADAIRIYLLNDAQTDTWQGDGISGLYLWGFQLESGAIASSYIKTTATSATRNADVIEMPTTLSNVVSITNLGLYSEDLTNVAWVKSETTVTSNSALAPNATTTADLVIPSTNNAIHSHKQSINVINNNRYIFSTHVKKNTGTSLVKLSIGYSSVLSGYFNLDSATWSNVTSKATVAHEALADGWYRISISGIATADGSVDFTISQYQAVETTFAGNGTSGNLFWGAQVEVSSYMNTYMGSYVATTGTIASGSFNVGWFNQSEGTIACEFTVNNTLSTGEDYTIFSIDDGTTTQQNAYHVKVTPQNIATTNVISNNTTSVDISSGTYAKDTTIRVGFGYKLNDVAVAYNGNAVTTDTTAPLPITSQSRIRFGSRGNVGENILKNGYINKFIYYPFKLDNPSIQELSKL